MSYKNQIRGVAQPGSASGLGPEGPRFKSLHPDQYNMKKAKIYKPSKTAMQSGKRKIKNWLLEFEKKNTSINPLMGWETSSDTMSSIKLEFPTKEQAINYAIKNNIEFDLIEPQKRNVITKSYSDNFLK